MMVRDLEYYACVTVMCCYSTVWVQRCRSPVRSRILIQSGSVNEWLNSTAGRESWVSGVPKCLNEGHVRVYQLKYLACGTCPLSALCTRPSIEIPYSWRISWGEGGEAGKEYAPNIITDYTILYWEQTAFYFQEHAPLHTARCLDTSKEVACVIFNLYFS